MPLHYLSYDHKTSMNQGQIVPIGIIEALPGDSFQHKVTALLRTQPLLAPVMHTAEIKIHHWFVPARLLWDKWEDFITGGEDGLDDSEHPVVESGSEGFGKGSLADHFGIDPTAPNLEVSALPFRAYAFIYNEFYRDQDLQDKVVWSKGSGEDTTTSTSLLRACWDKDYFTSARPTSQKGDEVQIPLAGVAPVKGIGKQNTTFAQGPVNVYETDEESTVNYANAASVTGADANRTFFVKGQDGRPQIYADLSNIPALSVNDLRLSTKLQVYKENMLRHGSRYVERLMAGFGVRPQDARLQLPEYLGGGKQVIQFSEVLQTAEGTTTPVGEMRGHGIAAMQSNRYRKYIPEYGFVISVMVIRPKTSYQDGVHKMWLRRVKEDYFQPELQHIGMQAIQNQEIYAKSANRSGVFGFQDRYDEYRFMFDQATGELRDTLDFWHMARKFSSEPALNASFVECSGVDRIFATNADQFIVRAKHSIQAKRVLHMNGKPMVF